MLIILIFIVIMGCILYKINIFREPYTGKSSQKMMIIGFIACFIILLSMKPSFTSDYLEEENDIYNKYLVDAILEGKTSINIELSEELKNLENPYDPTQREEMEYSFDTAYYDGKYYVYFGIVPAIILFVPFKLITGTYLSTIEGTFLFVILSVIASTILIIQIYKRWFKKVPFNLLILFIIAGCFSGLYIWNTWRMWVYELVLMAGYFFVQLGLICILKATKDKENVNLKYVFLSCLSMALAVGCRPTLVLASIILIPFLYQILKQAYGNKSLKKTFISIIVPYIIVAIPLMIYNYARFGNIFEFGAKYQLTIVDVTNLSERYKDIPKGLYQYLIQPPHLKEEFPYMSIDYSTEGNTDNYYNGGIVCGILFLNLTIIGCIFWYKYYKKVKDPILKGMMITLPIVGIVMCVLTVYMGGTVQRYAVDFFWMFSILAMIIWFLMYENAEKERNKKVIIITVLILIGISILINFLGTFLNSEYNYLEQFYPELFQFFEF